MDSYSEIVQTLLRNRGITTDDAVAAFLNPAYEAQTHDPFAMLGMQQAVERILAALKKGEKIAIYSDFDADGIPGGVILHDFFKKIAYDNAINYIPHRDREGYGFHASAVEKLAQENVNLIITVDVGINAVAAVEKATELNIDVIITDHHEPQEELPAALAVLNPKQKECTYPFDGLCGAGVAYKLVQALLRQRDFAQVPEGWEKWLLDLVAISTVADMVPLTGENRALVHWGLFVLRKSRRPGIVALCRKLRLTQSLLAEDDIGFSFGPRINAASRMGHPDDAFNLLCTDDVAEAEALVSKLESLNNKRKGAVASIVKQAKQKFIHRAEEGELPQVLVTGDPTWSPALVGLAASSLSDHFGRTVCLWGREGTGQLKGSCRTDGSVSAVAMFAAAGEALLHYGGHHAAGGFAVADDKIHTLGESLEAAYTSAAREAAREVRDAEVALSLQMLNERLYRDISQLAPFGIGNPKPIFSFVGSTVQEVRSFGKEQNHVEITVTDATGTQRKASCFFATPSSFSREPVVGGVVELRATFEKSSFAGRRTLELRIVDVV